MKVITAIYLVLNIPNSFLNIIFENDFYQKEFL